MRNICKSGENYIWLFIFYLRLWQQLQKPYLRLCLYVCMYVMYLCMYVCMFLWKWMSVSPPRKMAAECVTKSYQKSSYLFPTTTNIYPKSPPVILSAIYILINDGASKGVHIFLDTNNNYLRYFFHIKEWRESVRKHFFQNLLSNL